MSWKKTPECAEFHVFNDIDKYNKKHHPIRFLFQNSIPDIFNGVVYAVKEMYWWCIHRVHPKHRYHVVRTALSPGYHDIPELMLYATFSLLVRYVEDEKCFDNIVWDNDDIHSCVASELEDLYHWWIIEYPKREGIESALYAQLDDSGFMATDPEKREVSDNNRIIYDKLNKLEVYWKEQDIYNIKRLVSIKDFMWT